jgi:hypothetical protein
MANYFFDFAFRRPCQYNRCAKCVRVPVRHRLAIAPIQQMINGPCLFHAHFSVHNDRTLFPGQNLSILRTDTFSFSTAPPIPRQLLLPAQQLGPHRIQMHIIKDRLQIACACFLRSSASARGDNFGDNSVKSPKSSAAWREQLRGGTHQQLPPGSSQSPKGHRHSQAPNKGCCRP